MKKFLLLLAIYSNIFGSDFSLSRFSMIVELGKRDEYVNISSIDSARNKQIKADKKDLSAYGIALFNVSPTPVG